MRENLIKEKHSGGMAGHFGRDKTISILREHYFLASNFIRCEEICVELSHMSSSQRI